MAPPVPTPDLCVTLRDQFGFDGFLEGQEDAIRAVLEGRDAVVIMPTGSGKSLCYQLSALVLDGITLVVSPLISLMKDQVDGLEARGLPATFLNSSLSPDAYRDRLAGLRAGRFRLVYVAPERFRNRRFMEALSANPVALIAVDEAHCISQWGHDFRPDYLRLRLAVERFPDARVMALTATATPEVRGDVVVQLGLGAGSRSEPAVLVSGFGRPNLHLAVRRCATHDAKLQRIRAVLEAFPTGLIYCSTRKQTEKVHRMLEQAGLRAAFYHAGLPDEERHAVQDRFMSGQIPLVVATNAFGMGVDRSDLRAVIHWDIPGSVEAYYQEIGRAGRDGRPAHCELLYNYADVRTQEFFIDGANPTRDNVLSVLDAVQTACANGPVTRSITEWTRGIGGIDNEMTVRTVMGVLERAGRIRRDQAPGERVYTTEWIPDADPGSLDRQFESLARKRARDEKKLTDLLDYVAGRSCRHAHLLRYFGEADPEEACSACDRCVAVRPEQAREPTEEEWVVVQKILSCAARMQGQFGLTRLVQVLIGSKARPVLDRRLDQLPTYGLLAAHREKDVRRIAEELIRERCLRIQGGEYPLVELTPHGREVMWRKAPVQIEFPARAAPSASVPPPADAPAPVVAALKAWRSRMAGARRAPAYTVCSNRTLNEIAAAMPESLAALEAVHGMGPSRVQTYGDAILKVLDPFRD